jgi:hypothetical protein
MSAKQKMISMQEMIEFYDAILRRDLDSRTRNYITALRDEAKAKLTAQAAE